MRVQFSTFENFGGFGSIADAIETYILEITCGGKKQTESFDAIPMAAARQFQSIIRQMYKDPRPCKAKISKMENFWSEMDQVHKLRENSIEYRNFAYGDKD